MKKVTLVYNLGGSIIRLSVNEIGETVGLTIKGIDKFDDGNAEQNALALIFEAGHDLQAEISEAFCKPDGRSYFRDECYLAKRAVEDRMMDAV